MKRFEHLLQLNMATLAALGAVLLGMGERSEAAPLLVIAAAAISLWITDIQQLFWLKQKWANLLMLLIAVISLPDAFAQGNELQTVNFARFLVYLQLILLFQRKDERTYWLLVMSSLLQVVVATLFSQGVGFGLLLAIYMLLGFSAMTLLMIYRQHRPQEADSDLTAAPATRKLASQPAVARRWPLATRSSELVPVAVDPGRLGLTGELFRRVGRMGLQTVVIAMVLFFALPRFGQVAWRSGLAQPVPMVGFTDEVTLGELGEAIESPQEVMRVRFYRYPSDSPQPVRGEIYLRGAVMTVYNRGQWQIGTPSTELGSHQLHRSRRTPASGVVQQKIAIESLDRSELFYVAPYLPLERSNMHIEVDLVQQRLRRQAYLCRRRFEYSLGTTAIVDGQQRPLIPATGKDLTTDCLQLPAGEDSAALPTLVTLAKRWVAESGLAADDVLGRARCLERKLALSPQFQYSLAGQDRDPDVDPIEDFLTKHPRGHCEYFATALTLMLRAVGIPARMVSGYKCDEWNEMGKYYQVRQLHAHTWVEAYLRPKQLPRDLIHGADYWPWNRAGGWLQLDPTPAAREEKPTWFTPVRHTFDWLDSAWSNYVVELDCQRQRDAIYQPIAQAATFLWQELTSAERWRSLFNSLSVSLYFDHLGRGAKAVVLALLGLLLVGLLAGLLWLLGRWLRYVYWGNKPRPAKRQRRRTEIEFYRRYEALMARWGLVRTAGQTQREFAQAAAAHLAAREDKTLATLPELIAESFYRVRFGSLPLDSLQAEAVEHALAMLAKQDSSRPLRPPRRSGS